MARPGDTGMLSGPIADTSSVEHLRKNTAALTPPEDVLAALDSIAG